MTQGSEDDDEDIEDARVYERYEWDCPYCNETNDDRDINQSGGVAKCEHCGEKVRLTQ